MLVVIPGSDVVHLLLWNRRVVAKRSEIVIDARPWELFALKFVFELPVGSGIDSFNVYPPYPFVWWLRRAPRPDVSGGSLESEF